jgi:hypothetical protein
MIFGIPSAQILPVAFHQPFFGIPSAQILHVHGFHQAKSYLFIGIPSESKSLCSLAFHQPKYHLFFGFPSAQILHVHGFHQAKSYLFIGSPSAQILPVLWHSISPYLASLFFGISSAQILTVH